LAEAAEIPVPEGVLTDEVDSRRQSIVDQLERAGLTLADYLGADGKTEDELTAELSDSASRAIRTQLLLDAFADAQEVTVSDDEFGYEIVHRAGHAGVSPQQYYDQLVRAGLASSVAVDVRRNKALGVLLEKLAIKDTTGHVVTMDELRAAAEEDHTGHDHD
jgi:trigger factor